MYLKKNGYYFLMAVTVVIIIAGFLHAEDCIMIKDFANDIGRIHLKPDPGWERGWSEFWVSPDIYNYPEEIYPGILNRTDVRIWNFSDHAVYNVSVKLFCSEPGLGVSFPSPWSEMVAHNVLGFIPPRSSRWVRLSWIPPEDRLSPDDPFLQLGVVIGTANDPQTSTWPQRDNNVAIKSIKLAMIPPGNTGSPDIVKFYIGNPEPAPGRVAVWIDRSEVPQGWDVYLTIPEGTFFSIAPYDSLSAAVKIKPPDDAVPGDHAVIRLSEVLRIDSGKTQSVGMGEGITVDAVIHGVSLQLDCDRSISVDSTDTLNVLATMINWMDYPDTLDLWGLVYLPNGRPVPAEPILVDKNIVVPTHGLRKEMISIPLDDRLESGDYIFEASIGEYYSTVEDKSFIEFSIPSE